jgi:hypothetical protein
MRVLLVAGLLSGTSSIGESEGVVAVRLVCAGTTRRYCSRKLCSSGDWDSRPMNVPALTSCAVVGSD